MESWVFTLPLVGAALTLWWSRGARSPGRFLLVTCLGGASITLPFLLDAGLRSMGWQGRSGGLLLVLGALAVLSCQRHCRHASLAVRRGFRPAGRRVTEEVEDLRHRLGGPEMDVVIGPPMGFELFAWAGGLGRPFVLATNGLLHYLEPEERRAILAHEVAHHTTGSLWLLAAAQAIAPAIALLVSPALSGDALLATAYGPRVEQFVQFVSPALSGGALLATAYGLQVALSCAVSRPIEFLCDEVAGREVGKDMTGQALEKLAARASLDHTSRPSRILHLFWTHPSTAKRVQRLRQPARSFAVVRDAVGPTIAVASLLFGAHLLAARPGWMVATVMFALGFCEILLWRAKRPNSLASLQKAPAPGRRLLWSLLALTVTSLAGLIAGGILKLEVLQGASILSVLACGLALPMVLVLGGRAQRLRQRTSVLLVDTPEEVISLANRKPRPFKRDPVLLQLLALAKWRVGDRSGAEEAFDRLDVGWPRYLEPRVVRAELLRPSNPTRSLQLLEDLPDTVPVVAACRAFSHLELGAVELAHV